MVHVSDAGGRHKMLAFSTEPNINTIDTIVNIKDSLNSSSSSSSSGSTTPTVVENITTNIHTSFLPKEHQYNLGIIAEEPSLLSSMIKNSSAEVMITDEDGSNGNVNFNDSLNSNSNTNMNIDDGFDLISASGSETMQLLDNESNASGASSNRVFTEEIVISSSKMSPNSMKSSTTITTTTTKVLSNVSNKGSNPFSNSHGNSAEQCWQENLGEPENLSNHTNDLEETPLLTAEKTSSSTNASTMTMTSNLKNRITSTSTKMTNSATSTTTDNISNDSTNISPITTNAVGVGTDSTIGTNFVPPLPKHGKLTNGTKQAGLKRVSFGSSKGSMVETLIYESPVSEEREIVKKTGAILTNGTARAVGIDANDSQDSTISGGSTGGSRPPSRVRVTFFESEKPLAVSSPESDILDLDLSNMTLPGSPNTVDRTTPSYNKQMSAEMGGWDNPFRPDGDLSKEADQIVELIKEGKPINDETLRSKSPSVNETMNSITLTNNQLNASPKGKGANGSTSNGGGGPVEVQHGVVAPAAQAGQVEHIVLKKKKGCCVIQ